MTEQRVTIDGAEYRVAEVDFLRCTSCGRETYTGLCGCATPAPAKTGRRLLGQLVAAEGESRIS